MKFRSAGRWGLELSVIGMGSWPASTDDESTAESLLCHAYDLGVRYFDTANFYLNGEREVTVGRALASYPRESYVLATKVSFPIGAPPNNQGLSRKHIIEQCDASLRRLGTDHIDLYQCHRFEPQTPLEETCRSMDDLITSGKILYWGVTSWPAAGIKAAVDLCARRDWSLPISDQEQYSALWREAEVEVIPACVEAGMAVVAWSPLAMGVLAGRYTSLAEIPQGSRATKPDAKWMTGFLREEVIETVRQAESLAREAGISPAQLALAWCLAQPGLASVVVGASSASQLDDSVGAADLDLDTDLLDAFDELTGAVQAR
jgi:aryl-alcohol dehydrogenase-like predicted oxidoreductase